MIIVLHHGMIQPQCNTFVELIKIVICLITNLLRNLNLAYLLFTMLWNSQMNLSKAWGKHRFHHYLVVPYLEIWQVHVRRGSRQSLSIEQSEGW